MDRLKNILQEADLKEGYKLLTKRERKIISLYYLEGFIDKEIASYYKVTRENIYKLRKNGLNKLKKIEIFEKLFSIGYFFTPFLYLYK